MFDAEKQRIGDTTYVTSAGASQSIRSGENQVVALDVYLLSEALAWCGILNSKKKLWLHNKVLHTNTDFHQCVKSWRKALEKCASYNKVIHLRSSL